MELDETKRSSLCETVSDFSLQNVKFKLKLNELKENLSSRAKPLSKSKVSSMDKFEKIIDDKKLLKVKIHKDNRSIEKLLKKALILKKSYETMRKLAKSEREKKLNRDNNYSDLNLLKSNMESERKTLNFNLREMKFLRCKSEEKTKTISLYVNDTKAKTDNKERTVNEYLCQIQHLRGKNQSLQESYNQEVYVLEKENEEFVSKMKYMKDRINNQKSRINEYKVKIDQLNVDLIDEETTFREIEYLNKLEYERLEKMIVELNKKVFDYQINCNLKDSNINWAKKTIIKSKDTIGELERFFLYENRTIQKVQFINEQLKDQSKQLTIKCSTISNPFNNTLNARQTARYSTTKSFNKTLLDK